MRVFASIPELRVTKKGIEKTKEIYTLCIASDLAGSKDRPPVVGASNETLPALAPEVDAALKFFLVSASNVFHKIRFDQPVSLSGSGILLYPPNDPKGMLALHVVVVESDAGKRSAGKVLAGVAKDKETKSAVDFLAKEFAKGAATAATLTTAFAAVVPVIGALVARNKDDILFEHGHSGFDFDEYGAQAGGADSEVGNDRVRMKLRLRTLPSGP